MVNGGAAKLTVEGEMRKEWRLAFVGMGGVAREVWNWLPEFSGRENLSFRVTGVASRRGGILSSADGLAPGEWESGGRAPAPAETIVEWLRSRPADVLIELSALNPQSGQPAIDYIRTAFTAGMHVVTANKGPEAFAWGELDALARSHGLGYRFEAAVLDGLPVFRVPALMPAGRLLRLEGIVNSTSNLVLTRMEEGCTLAQAIAEARGLGIAEEDASWDLDGWDAVMKACVLGNVLLGARLRPRDVSRQGIAGIGEPEVKAARRRGRVIRLIIQVDETGARVAPEEFPEHHLYASVRGTSNVLTWHFDGFGAFSVVEPSPGLRQTAYGVVADLVCLARGDLWSGGPAQPRPAAGGRARAGDGPSV